MKNTLKNLLFATVLFTSVFHAQSQSEDGSERLLAERSQDWDETSLKWVNSDSFTYLYNAKGFQNLKKYCYYEPASTAWKPYNLLYFNYDANNNLTYQLDSEILQPIKNNIYEFTYNSDNKEIVKVIKKINNLNQYENSFRYQTSYTAFKAINVYLLETYDALNKVWQSAERTVYTYNDQELNTNITIERWDKTLNNWGPYQRTNYTYNASGKMLTEVHESYNKSNSAYEFSNKYSYAYYANNQILYTTFALWDKGVNGWANKLTVSSSYNAAGLLSDELHEIWNNTSKTWENNSYYKLTYDAKNRLLTNTYSLWNSTGSKFEESTRYTLSYDANGYKTHQLDEIWSTNLKAWTNKKEQDFWYEPNPLFVGTQSLQTAKPITVYPNPVADDRFFVKTENATAYHLSDLSGKTMQQGNLLAGENTIPMQNVASGLYIFKAGNQSVKILKP